MPCLITCGGSSLSKLSGVAQIDMANNSMSQESKTVGTGGLVNTLYGTASAKSGSLIGWAWGLSRIIDGLEKCPRGRHRSESARRHWLFTQRQGRSSHGRVRRTRRAHADAGGRVRRLGRVAYLAGRKEGRPEYPGVRRDRR